MCIWCLANVWLVSYLMSTQCFSVVYLTCIWHLPCIWMMCVFYAYQTCIDLQAYHILIKHVLIKSRMDWYWWVVEMSGVGPACGCLVVRWCLRVKNISSQFNHIALVSDHCQHCNDNMAWHSSATCDHRFTYARHLWNHSTKKRSPDCPAEGFNLDMGWSLNLVDT